MKIEAGGPSTQEALVVATADDLTWDAEAEVVVVGFGSAGANAALVAQEHGADVLIVDRFAGGGATLWSGGVIYGSGTRFQRAAGIDDSPDDMFDYLAQEKMSVQPETLRRFCEESGPQIEWLADLGVKYGGDVFEDPASFPPEGFFLYYSGNEKRPFYRARAKPAPRGHRPVGKGPGGIYYFTALRRAVEDRGIRLMMHAPVRRLIMDASGACLGIEIAWIPPEEQAAHAAINAKVVPLSPATAGRADQACSEARAFESRFTERRRIRAMAGVVLAAGGFAYDVERLGRHASILAEKRKCLMRLGTLGDDGSGIDLGLSAGGCTAFMDSFFISRSIAPPNALLRGLLINKRGERYASEDTFAPFLGETMARQPDGDSWLILDAQSYRLARRQALFPGKGMRLFTLPALLTMFLGGTRKAGSIEGLARKIGVPADGLARTVAHVTTLWAVGKDDLGKVPDNIALFGAGPFYALNVGIGYKFAPTMVFSMGGLKVDERSGAVIRPDGTPVPGLYAAGRTAVGLMSAADVNGMSIADTVFSGRRAGASAALRATNRQS